MIDWEKVHAAEIKKAARKYADRRLYRTPKRMRARRRHDLIQAFTAGATGWAGLYEHQVQMRIKDNQERS